MQMTRAIAAIAATAALALPAAAHARPLNATELAAAQTADTMWGNELACSYEALPFAELKASGQFYNLGGCHIRIRDDQGFLQACTTLAHEGGHARGLQHTTVDDGSIMSLHPDPPAVCDQADDRRVRAMNAPLRRTVKRKLKRCKRYRKSTRRAGCRRRARSSLYLLVHTS